MKMNLVLEACSVEELTNILQMLQANKQTGVKVKLTPKEEDLETQIKDLIEELIGLGKRDEIINIFKTFKASKFSDIDKSNHVDVLKLLRGLKDER